MADLMTTHVMQERRLKGLGLLVRIPAAQCWRLQCVRLTIMHVKAQLRLFVAHL